jgi:hypothetical protein
MLPQSYLANTTGAILIGVVFSAVYVPLKYERRRTLFSDTDTADYMESRFSKSSRTTSIIVTRIASF